MDTYFLALIMGWYLLIVGLLLMFRHDQMKGIMTDLLADKSTFFLLALFSFIIGLLLVLSHSKWMMGWPVIITIISWMILITSVFRLFFPKMAIKMARAILKDKTFLSGQGCVLLVLGGYLLYKVYA
ncbi:MAG TPA: hypothetical protein VHD33_05890 [Legionellaceae bacterium]|nr:hypothetical protein [Legionellaceae bacterium]